MLRLACYTLLLFRPISEHSKLLNNYHSCILFIMYLIIPIHAQYIIILVDVRFCIHHSYLFFILLFSSVVFAIIVDSLVSVHLNSKGYR